MLCTAWLIHDSPAHLSLDVLLQISEGGDEKGKTENTLTSLEIQKSENGHKWLI